MLRRLLLLLFVIAMGVPGVVWSARADDFSDALKPLAEDSYSDTIAVIERLSELADPRAADLLRALGDGRLALRKNDKSALILKGDDASKGAVDAATGKDVPDLKSDDVDPVRVNNRVRQAVQAALGRFGLFSKDPKDRISALREIHKNPTAANLPLLEKAAAEEKDPAVLSELKRALAAARLIAGKKEDQLAAINELSVASDIETRSLLQNTATAAGVDPDVKAAAERAMGEIDSRLARLRLIQTVFQGLSLGSVLLLAAIGLSITFGVMGVINMAHGEMVMIGAYTTFVVQQIIRSAAPGLMDWSLFAAIPAAFAVAGTVGMALERGVIRYLYGRPLETLLMTWGISMIIQQGIRLIFGPTNREVSAPSWMTGSVDIAGVALTQNRIWIIVFGILVLIVTIMVTKRTWFGLQMRAVVQNRSMASAMGVRTNRIDALTFGLGSGIAGMAGVALAQIDNVSPNLGQGYIVDSFMVVVFGGVGSFNGTLIGSMLLGIVNKFLEPYAGAVLGKIAVLVAIILFIQFRPRGLFALKGRAVEN
ncbi:MAG: urea ABC transporter permease subunit UrtB [Alphaproteobacteria bacterium]